MARWGALGKYGALCAWLRALPEGQASAELAFTEIEALIGTPLPPSALDAWYWHSSSTAARYWRTTRFRARLLQEAERVRFTRMEAQP